MTEHKFIETLYSDEWEIETDNGFFPITAIHKTIPFDVWELQTQNNCKLFCANTHVVFDEHLAEIFVENLTTNTKIKTKFGNSQIIKIQKTKRQEEMFDVSVQSKQHRFYTNDILSHNTTSTCAYLLHFAIFNTDKNITIFANKADTAREILDKIMTNLEHLPFFLQPGVKSYNKSRIEFDNNSRILTFATTKSSARSYSSSIAYLDEFAWVDNDVEFYTSVYPIISSGTNSKIIISSSARNMNLFYKLVTDAKNQKNNFKVLEVNWWDVPGRDQAWKEETIRNTSERQFEQEHGNKFLGSAGTLIPADILEKLVYADPKGVIRNTYIYKKAQLDHSYVLCADPAHGTLKDDSAISVIDITQLPYEQVLTFYDNTIAPMAFAKRITEIANDYNNAFILIENNDIGSQVAKDILFDYEYENIWMTGTLPGIKTTKKSKLIGCIALKELLSTQKIIINDFKTITQLSCFVDKNGKYSADSGTDHDDLVMTLVLLAYAHKSKILESINDETLLTQENEDNEPPMIMKSDDILINESLKEYGILNKEDIAWLLS